MKKAPVVMYIDDEPMLCRVAKLILTRAGLTVVTFTDANAALGYLAEHPVAVVVCDYRMPVLNGLQLLERIEQEGPFFLVSGDLEMDELVEGRPGVTGFLTKPLQPEELIATIRRVVGHPSEE